MQTIPLQAVPSQTLNVTLNNQLCTLDIYTRGIESPALYVDLYVNNTLIIGGVIARNGVCIVRDKYLGFTGDLCFSDTQGATDPVYTGLGSRYVLAYVLPGDVTSTVQTLA